MERRKFIHIGSWAIPLAGILPSTAATIISTSTVISGVDKENEINFEVPADYTLNIGNTLFYCYQQLHMDYV